MKDNNTQELKKQLLAAENKIAELQAQLSNSAKLNSTSSEFDYQKYYKIIAENATDIVGVLNLNFQFEYISPSVEALTGYTVAEGMTLQLNDFLTPESAKKAMEVHQACLNKGGCTNILELVFTRKDKSIFHAEVITKPVFNNSGSFIGIHASCRDISDRVQLVKNLNTEREWNRLLISNLNDRILVFNKDAKLVFSSYMPNWFDPQHPQFTENAQFNPIHQDDMPKVLEGLKKLFKTGGSNRMDYRSKGNGDDYKWVEGNGTLVELPGKKGPYLINVVRDIEERKQLEEKLSKSNNTKDLLFSIIAHDLRSPFNALIGFSSQLAEEYDQYDEKTIKRFIDIIANTTKNTFKLLENLLDWTRVQKGSFNIKKENFDANEVINACVLLYNNIAERKSIRIIADTPNQSMVYADINTINTVLENLLNNAIKFSNPESEIHIHAEKKQTHIQVSVKDSGIGMDKDFCEKLFTLNKNLTRPGTKNEKGTGLGLVLCKDFVEMNNGKIWIESEPNKGSTFLFTIPLAENCN